MGTDKYTHYDKNVNVQEIILFLMMQNEAPCINNNIRTMSGERVYHAYAIYAICMLHASATSAFICSRSLSFLSCATSCVDYANSSVETNSSMLQ